MITLAPIYTPPRRKTIDDIPTQITGAMAVKLYLLGALLWDYTDTILDIASSLRIASTRSHSRTVRALRLDYYRDRQYLIDPEHVAKETELALLFEEISAPALAELNSRLNAEIENLPLTPDLALLAKAVQIALTILDVMKAYAARCDKWLAAQGVRGHSILDDRFRTLASILPRFNPPGIPVTSPARRHTSDALLAELLRIELYDDRGPIHSI